MTLSTPALEALSLRKSYGPAAVLQGFSMQVAYGEIRALVGQNGCGKSTFVKALSGLLPVDGGSLELHGRPLSRPGRDRRTPRIAVIHQDVGLADAMTVVENVEVGRPRGAAMVAPIDFRAERARLSELMAQLDVDLPLDAAVATLTAAEKALLAIVRAMRHAEGPPGEHVFVFDEPTAALSRAEADMLLALMRRLAATGCAIVFISHRLAEVMAVCHTATVMRGGRDVAHLRIRETSRDELATHMLGRPLHDFYPRPTTLPRDPTRVSVRRLAGRRLLGIDFDLRAGEVVGMTGLAGMGHEEVPELLCGAATPTAGHCSVDGRPRRFASPIEAQRAGVVLVPGDRLREAVWLEGTAEENITLPVLRRHIGPGGVSRSALGRVARGLMARFEVRPAEPGIRLDGFSGGNQQKIVFAKWMQLEPAVLLLDEPTQGVDLGAAALLLRCVQEAAAGGCAVLVLSGDHEQLAAVCHRVLVVHEGRITAELRGPDLNEAMLLRASQGGRVAVEKETLR